RARRLRARAARSGKPALVDEERRDHAAFVGFSFVALARRHRAVRRQSDSIPVGSAAATTRRRRGRILMRRLALVAVLLAAGCQQASNPPVMSGGELRWGGDAEGGAPFVEADPADPSKVRGFDVEIAGMIARGLGKTPRFVQVQWSSIEASLERG